MTAENFNMFKDLVLDDPEMQHTLSGIEDRDQFVARVLELGGKVGMEFGREDVEDAMRAARRSWTERWT